MECTSENNNTITIIVLLTWNVLSIQDEWWIVLSI